MIKGAQTCWLHGRADWIARSGGVFAASAGLGLATGLQVPRLRSTACAIAGRPRKKLKADRLDESDGFAGANDISPARSASTHPRPNFQTLQDRLGIFESWKLVS